MQMNPKIKATLNVMLSNLLLSMAAIVLSLIVAAFIMLTVGYNPIKAYLALYDGAFGSVNAVSNTLSKSIPLMFTGLAFAFASKGGMFNIGGEGQLYVGALASTAVAIALGNAPKFIILPAAILAGMLAGGLLGGFVGVAKAKLHLNEVIVAIMVNYIASLLTSYFVNGPMKAAKSMTAQSDLIPNSALLQKIIPKTQLTTALYIALAAVVIVYFFFKKTRAGYNIRVVGENLFAAQASGVNKTMVIILTMGASGAVAALAGVTEVLGKYGRFYRWIFSGFWIHWNCCCGFGKQQSVRYYSDRNSIWSTGFGSSKNELCSGNFSQYGDGHSGVGNSVRCNSANCAVDEYKGG